MKDLKILYAAAALYIGIVLWAWVSHSSAPAHASADDQTVPATTDLTGERPYCGAAIQLQRPDAVDLYKKTIDQVADDGFDTVSFVVDSRQENTGSMWMYLDIRKTMLPSELADLISYAKGKHLRVLLMPIVLLDDEDDPGWRGTLKPHNFKGDADWHHWFDNYRDLMGFYAHIAQDNGVDILVVGSELVSSEEHLDEWITTINSIRSVFKGKLTYSSNWDRYHKVPFWKYLDMVGMNSYWTLGNDRDVPPDVIQFNWRKIQEEMFQFLATVHKPVILLEAGWCSLANAAKDPWDYTQTDLDADTDLQDKLYDGFFDSWWGKSQLAGFMIWEYRPEGDPTGKAYSPQGKPAEQILRRWLTKPRWQIGTP